MKEEEDKDYIYKEHKWTGREFLNKEGYYGNAAININFQLPSMEKDSTFAWTDCYFDISNCSRTICLELSMEKEYENSLHKLETIERVCREAREQLREFRRIYELRLKVIEENKEKRSEEDTSDSK